MGKALDAEVEKQRLDLRGKTVAEIASILASPPVGLENGVDEPLAHALPVVPASSPIAPDPSGLANALPIIPQIANAPPMAPGTGSPNLDLKSRQVERKIAVEELHASRPLHDQGPSVARFGRLSFFVVLAAIIAIGNEPLSLGVSINDVSGGDRVVLAGFAIGTSLSTGTPLGFTGWQMLARDVGKALVYPPKDFVGVMVAAVDLRSPGDWLIESQTVRLEWISDAQQAPRR
jgi:hypothetical protein